MKTTLNIETLLYQFLQTSMLKSTVTGEVYKRKRPVNSQLEDIVVIALPAPNLQIQDCVVNVNIHVPNLAVTHNGSTERLPNLERLEALGNMAVDGLRETWAPGGDWHFELQQQNVFEDTEGDNHYINIRLDFYSINLLN